MLKRIAALAAVTAAVLLPVAPASAEWCIVQEPTIHFYVCL